MDGIATEQERKFAGRLFGRAVLTAYDRILDARPRHQPDSNEPLNAAARSGPYYPGIGAFTRNADGRVFVDGILEGSPADKAGLKFGDKILLVDGRPYGLIESFRHKIGATAELTIRRTASAAPERLTATVIPIRPVQAFSDATEASAHIIERKEGITSASNG